MVKTTKIDFDFFLKQKEIMSHKILNSENDEPSLILPNGTKIWHKNDKKHRETKDEKGFILPAVITFDGTKIWYNNDLFFRDNDLPSIEWADGTKEWYHGKVLHRVTKNSKGNTLPAVIYMSGEMQWYKNGKLHRDEDLPSIIDEKGNMVWYKNGKIHREDEYGKLLPAKISPEGKLEWYYEGYKINPDSELIIKPSIQNCQKCPYCNKYMEYGETTVIYTGTQYEFQGWKCHNHC